VKTQTAERDALMKEHAKQIDRTYFFFLECRCSLFSLLLVRRGAESACCGAQASTEGSSRGICLVGILQPRLTLFPLQRSGDKYMVEREVCWSICCFVSCALVAHWCHRCLNWSSAWRANTFRSTLGNMPLCSSASDSVCSLCLHRSVSSRL
jgi:hypothetical protein